MSVPASRKSTSSVRRRRSHHALKALNVSPCENCKEAVRPHHACGNCGVYKGRKVLDTSSNNEQMIRKAAQETTEEPKKTSKA